jgi:signal peptidase I
MFTDDPISGKNDFDDEDEVEDIEYDGSSKVGYAFKSILMFMVDVVINAVIIIALVFIIRHFIFSPFQVSGPSMCDTLNNFSGKCVHGNGEYIIVNKIPYIEISGWSISDYERGDIIVFVPPEGEEGEFFIKRIIGLPGETVKLVDGEVYIYNDEYTDGFKLDEKYLNESNYGKTYSFDTSLSEFEVPEGMYFVMGDNRRASSDSRRCFGLSDCTEESAFLDEDAIQGKGIVIIWPLDRIRLFGDYDYGM